MSEPVRYTQRPAASPAEAVGQLQASLREAEQVVAALGDAHLACRLDRIRRLLSAIELEPPGAARARRAGGPDDAA